MAASHTLKKRATDKAMQGSGRAECRAVPALCAGADLPAGPGLPPEAISLGVQGGY